MDNVHHSNDPHCRELEQLAAAAATRDYSISSQEDNEVRQGENTLVNRSDHVNTVIISASAPQIISYVDSYPTTRSQLIPVRTYNVQPHFENLTPVPHSYNPRLVMVASTSHSFGNFQTDRESGQEIELPAVNGVHYEATYPSSVENSLSLVNHGHSDHGHDGRHIVNCAEPIALQQQSDESLKGPIHDVSNAKAIVDPPKIDPAKDTNATESVGKSSSKKDEKSPISPLKDADGKLYYPCSHCDTKSVSVASWKQHQNEHSTKRNGLSLELKIEIIKRIAAGEKKADIAEEYAVNRSTIKSIMKKSNSYLSCWNQGLYNPDTKRLKGPKREDVELALYSWYKQALDKNAPISGPILCAKAMDFAHKLGHTDFKATHGWLDRFKKRKKISFGKGSLKRSKVNIPLEEERNAEANNPVFSRVISENEPSDIFVLEEIGLLYRASPKEVGPMKGQRCPGGMRAQDRLTILLCTNVTGIEKFPPLVVGNCKSYRNLRFARSLPLNYIYDENSWVNSEIISAWLYDIDTWFTKQNRKVLLLAASLPIHSSASKLKLQSIKFMILPSLSPSPLRHLATFVFKKFYRFNILIEWINVLSKAKANSGPTCPPSLSLEVCLHLLYSAWNGISDRAITASFQKTGLTNYGVWCHNEPNTVNFPKAQQFLENLESFGHCDSGVSFEDYVHFDDNVQVCDLKDDEEILAVVRRMKKERRREDGTDNHGGLVATLPAEANDMQEDLQAQRIMLSKVDKAFANIRQFIQYQDGTQEMFQVLSNLELLFNKSLSHKYPTHYPQ